MRKIINKIKKNEFDVLLLIILLLSLITLPVAIKANDELWNFANCYKMFNGYKIYRDLNVIITPLFFFIAQIFLKIFGASMLSFRIYNIVISTVLLMLIYLIFRSLKIVRRRAIFYTIVITFLLRGMIAAGANYNIMAIIPVLLAIIMVIKEKENSIILGVLLFLTFMLKQNVYVYFAIGIFCYKFVNVKKCEKNIIDLLKIYSVSLICIFVFLLYLYLDNNLYNFINFCFLGISEFGTKNLVIHWIDSQLIYISLISIVFTMIMVFNKKINKNIEKNVITNSKNILCFGIPLLLISYPIVNYYHATLSSLIIFIEFIYLIENILIKHIEIQPKKEKKIYIILIFAFVIYSSMWIIKIKTPLNNDFVLNKNGPLYGTLSKKEDVENNKVICEFIKEQEKNNINVKVLSYKANLYMLQLNKNNGVFDLAFLGNLGAGGETGLIDAIKQLNKTIILIPSDVDKMGYQESKKVREYIINNYKKIGEIEEYSIFYIK